MSATVAAGRADEAADAGRRPPSRLRRRTGARRRASGPLQLLLGLMALYTLLPLYWLLVNATKTNGGLFTSNGLWFGSSFALWDNIVDTVTYRDGIYLVWLANTALYAGIGGVGATLIATLGGYGLAKFDFPGRRLVRSVVFGAITIPATALAVPTFLLFARLHVTNTYWSILVPSLVSPFGLYLMHAYAQEAVPDSLLEAARIDGANEWTIFWRVASRQLTPGFATVLLFNVVHVWNNYFLPLIMLREPSLYPLTVGLNQLNNQVNSGSDAAPVYNIVITGSLLAIVPLVVAFLLLQRLWQSGLSAGSLK